MCIIKEAQELAMIMADIEFDQMRKDGQNKLEKNERPPRRKRKNEKSLQKKRREKKKRKGLIKMWWQK